MMRIEFTITKLTKNVSKTDESGKAITVERVVYAYDKDIEKWVDEGFEIVSAEIVFRNLTKSQKERYLEGKKVEKVIKEKTEKEIAVDDIISSVSICTVEELVELCEQEGLDIVLGKYPKKADKQAAIIEAIKARG